MVFVSFLFGFLGLITQHFHVQDWWQPITITGTVLGIEDFLIGMFIGGVAAVIYEEVYKKKMVRIKKKKPLFLIALSCVLTAIIAFSIFHYVFKLHSFYSLLIFVSLGIFTIMYFRRDLIKDSIVSGVLMLFIGIVVYFILFLVMPDYFEKFWYLGDRWFANLFLGIPLAEYFWFFLAGSFIGPLYEFWQEGRLVSE